MKAVASDEVIISPSRGIEQTFGQRIRTTIPLAFTWTARDLRVRYRQSILRSGWSLLQPLAILITYGWVLTAVLDVTSADAPYLTFAWAGIVPFTFFSQGLGQGVGSIQQAGPIISRIYFPREVLPLSVLGGAAVDLAIMTATLIAVAWFQVGPPTMHLIALVPVYLMLFLWTAAITISAAALTVYRRDLNFAVPLFLRVLFIATPVMYPAALIENVAPWLVALNPIAVVIEATRDVIYRGEWPNMALLGAHLTVGAVVLAATFVLFRRLEPRMSDFA